MSAAPSSLFDPSCPCGSGHRLSECCAAVTGGEYTDDEVGQVIDRLAHFGNRGEFGAPVRRATRTLIVDLKPAVKERLFRDREIEIKTALFHLLNCQLPVRRDTTIAQELLRRDAKLWPGRLRALLAQWAAQSLSLYEILEVHPGAGVTVRDHLRAATVDVHEVLGSGEMRPGWWLLALVRMRPDGAPVFDPPLLPFVDAGVERVRNWLAALPPAPAQGRDPRAHVAPLFVLWQEEMAKALMAPPPRVVGPDGDEVVFCTSYFDIDDRAALLAALASWPDWEREDPDDEPDDETDDGEPVDVWVWFETLEDGMRRSLGTLYLDVDGGELETRSRGYDEQASQRLCTVPGVRWMGTDEESAQEMMERLRNEDPADDDETTSPDLADHHPELREAMAKMLDKHYRSWIDEPVPMFGGRTPRQMAKIDPQAVAREIWSICHPRGGAPHYDASWMYAELGVPAPDPGRFRPGVREDGASQ